MAENSYIFSKEGFKSAFAQSQQFRNQTWDNISDKGRLSIGIKLPNVAKSGYKFPTHNSIEYYKSTDKYKNCTSDDSALQKLQYENKQFLPFNEVLIKPEFVYPEKIAQLF